jgi:hypothetical protein
VFKRSRLFRVLTGIGVGVLSIAGLVGTNTVQAAGVSGPAFYVDGKLYRTVATPTDLSDTGAPDKSFDVIYQFFGLQRNVATAAPGDPGYNGGRWKVHGLSFSNYAGAIANPVVDMNGNGVLDYDEEVLAAISHGYATDTGVIKVFVCTVNPVPANEQ